VSTVGGTIIVDLLERIETLEEQDPGTGKPAPDQPGKEDRPHGPEQVTQKSQEALAEAQALP
jgi:hypothetical protein